MHERADLYFLAERSLGDEAWFCCPRCGNKKLKDFEMREGFIQFSCNKKSCGVQCQISFTDRTSEPQGYFGLNARWA